MPAAPTKTRGPKCSLCSQNFRTNAKLVKHSLSTGHCADRCCEPCSRLFTTKEGLDAHSKSSIHTKSSSSGTSKKSSKIPTPRAPLVITKQQECTLCSKLFQTKAQLAQHSLDSGHGDDRCCRPCLRLFRTKEALEAHKRSFNCTITADKGTQTSTQVLQQDHRLVCRGNSYRRIPEQDQVAILQTLLSRCHSRTTLQRHGYSISGDGSDQEKPGFPGRVRDAKDEILLAPQQNERRRKTRKAVVLDCEMVGVRGGKSELVSLAAIDFLTGEIILDSLVVPQQPVLNWRTQIHGISPAGLSVARAQGLTLDGWQAAAAELFKHVDQDTVLIGQSLQNDLAALHIQHTCVVDSAILASEAVFGNKGKPQYWGLGLKNLSSELLGLKIREGAPLGASKIHDGLEDVLATREVVLCCLEQPTAFEAWARGKRIGFERAQWRKARRGKTQTRKRKEPRTNDEHYDGDEYMSDEILRWDDVIDYEMWPKSP